MKMPGRIVSLLFLLISIEASAQKQKIVFATQWLPQAQFAGYYVAREKGFYDEAGLDVTIKYPPATGNALSYLTDGTADIISQFLISAMKAKSAGTDLVNIAQFSEHSAILFVSLKESGIKTLDDIRGKKVGVWKSGFYEAPKAFLSNKKINVQWVPIASTVNLFLMNGIDVMTVMWYNEYNQIYLSGINEDEMNTFFLSKYGYDIPEDGLYVLSKTLKAKPENLRAFVKASLKGWQYAASHFDYALDLVLKKMHDDKISANKAHQKWMLEKVLELQGFKTGKTKQTILEEADFNKAKEVLQFSGSKTKTLLFKDFSKPVVSKTDK